MSGLVKTPFLLHKSQIYQWHERLLQPSLSCQYWKFKFAKSVIILRFFISQTFPCIYNFFFSLFCFGNSTRKHLHSKIRMVLLRNFEFKWMLFLDKLLTLQKSHLELCALKSAGRFIGKHQCWRFLLNKGVGIRPAI